MSKSSDRFLFISDLQIPFEAPAALKFCQAVARDFKINLKDSVYNVGDEVDHYFGGQWEKSVAGHHTALSEIEDSKARLKEWYRAFPHMQLAVSNHGLRWARKAAAAQIPSAMIVPYQKIIEAPKTWVWKERWVIPARHPILMIHGMGYTGQNGHRNAAIDSGMNTVIGHLHSHAAISYLKTGASRFWAMNVGCLINETAYCFEYGRYNRQKPVLGVGVVVDGGLTPIFVPYERF